MPSTLTRTQKRQHQTKEKIFRVAMDLFHQKGFDHTTVADITEAADIGKGTFFTYFTTKDAIFGQLGEMMMETMAAAAHKSMEANRSLGEVLTDTLTATAPWLETNQSLARQVIRSGYAFEADTPNQLRLLDLLMDLLRAGQAKAECDADLNLEDAAVSLAGIYFAAVTIWTVANQRPLRDRLQGSIGILLKGILC